MNTKGAKTRDQIDLGLGAILAGAQPAKEVEVSIELSSPASKSASTQWTLGNKHHPPKSEFDLLADERKWSEIVGRVESRLQDKGDIEARLWWIRGHLGAFSMPVSYLAAPLESVCRDLQGIELKPELAALLQETGLLALVRLEDVGERSLAEALRKVLELVGVNQPRGAGSRRRLGTSSFRSLESLGQGSAPTVPSQPEVESVPAPAISRRRRLVWTSACVVVVVALLALDRLFPHVRSPTRGIASESFIEPPREIELSPPVPERREPGGRLGALFYSLEGDSGRSSTQPTLAAPQGTTAKPEDSKIVGESAQAASAAPASEPSRVQPEPPTKERVNTEGPVEGPEFRERLDRDPPGERGLRRGEPPREELQGGPPEAVLPEAAPYGFDHKRTYRVLERTAVLSAPSHGGRVIGHLERGDRVLVEGKLGRWLRLRSKKGRGGYVLALDVEQVPDFQDPR